LYSAAVGAATTPKRLAMTFDELSDFIQKRMRMSHVYQPVMLTCLLMNKGHASDREIAKSILQRDESQIEYYEKVTNEMVGRVLRRHEVVRKEGKNYFLSGFERLTEEEIGRLIELCQHRLDDYLVRRGDRMWQHRRLAEGYISGTLRYEVLKRAKFRCELCGVPADEKALEVDHIVPRNRGGIDDISNLQALCYSCNAMKQDRDDTDFREVARSYEHREGDCVFSNLPPERHVLENRLAIAILDAFPVTASYMLVLPKRHSPSYFDLGRPELNACNLLLEAAKARIEQEDAAVRGFNIGINSGLAAGQTVLHCHIHLIPRREGDVSDPAGGVRHVIPGRGYYERA
jgi:diadenosine tetraphosphate (Ap4A) HIT family hydrolase/5-methylcytosine-specific restriction endonuclease McrA